MGRLPHSVIQILTFDELHCFQSAPGQKGKSLNYYTHLLRNRYTLVSNIHFFAFYSLYHKPK